MELRRRVAARLVRLGLACQGLANRIMQGSPYMILCIFTWGTFTVPHNSHEPHNGNGRQQSHNSP